MANKVIVIRQGPVRQGTHYPALCDALGLEPRQRPRKPVLRRPCAVGWPVVRMKSMGHVGVNHKLTGAGCSVTRRTGAGQCRFHLLHSVQRNAGVLPAVEPQHRRFA